MKVAVCLSHNKLFTFFPKKSFVNFLCFSMFMQQPIVQIQFLMFHVMTSLVRIIAQKDCTKRVANQSGEALEVQRTMYAAVYVQTIQPAHLRLLQHQMFGGQVLCHLQVATHLWSSGFGLLPATTFSIKKNFIHTHLFIRK